MYKLITNLILCRCCGAQVKQACEGFLDLCDDCIQEENNADSLKQQRKIHDLYSCGLIREYWD